MASGMNFSPEYNILPRNTSQLTMRNLLLIWIPVNSVLIPDDHFDDTATLNYKCEKTERRSLSDVVCPKGQFFSKHLLAKQINLNHKLDGIDFRFRVNVFELLKVIFAALNAILTAGKKRQKSVVSCLAFNGTQCWCIYSSWSSTVCGLLIRCWAVVLCIVKAWCLDLCVSSGISFSMCICYYAELCLFERCVCLLPDWLQWFSVDQKLVYM